MAHSETLNGLKVAILATDGFEQVELTEPQKALDAAGATTHVISPSAGTIRAWDKEDWGIEVEVDRALDEVRPGDYDALLLPGGVMNPDHLRMNADAVVFTRSFFDAGKPVAAICHGPWMLVEADAVEGRRLTSYGSIQTDLTNAGADWVNEPVVVDDNGPNTLVTSRNPDDLEAFCDALVSVFAAADVPA